MEQQQKATEEKAAMAQKAAAEEMEQMKAQLRQTQQQMEQLSRQFQAQSGAAAKVEVVVLDAEVPQQARRDAPEGAPGAPETKMQRLAAPRHTAEMMDDADALMAAAEAKANAK